MVVVVVIVEPQHPLTPLKGKGKEEGE